MSKKQRGSLIALDAIAIFLGIVELFTCQLIFKYSNNINMSRLFIVLSIIAIILIIESIISIKKEKGLN